MHELTSLVQAILNHLGETPPLKVDGVEGPLTKKAVEQFQRAYSLKADGVVGPLTTAALVKALEAKKT